jgi:hypothetical protein
MTPIDCDLCRPCQRPGGCDPAERCERTRHHVLGLLNAGYMLAVGRQPAALESALVGQPPWWRWALRDGYRAGEIVRRWDSGDAKNAKRMMDRP